MTRTYAERRAIDRLRMRDVRRGMFTQEQARQIEAWRAENETAIKAEVARMQGGRDETR